MVKNGDTIDSCCFLRKITVFIMAELPSQAGSYEQTRAIVAQLLNAADRDGSEVGVIRSQQDVINMLTNTKLCGLVDILKQDMKNVRILKF